MDGLTKILELVQAQPEKEIYRKRFLSLLSELPDSEDKQSHILALARTILEVSPDEALSLAMGVYNQNNKHIDALKIMNEALLKLGKGSQAMAIQEELKELEQPQLEAIAAQDEATVIAPIPTAPSPPPAPEEIQLETIQMPAFDPIDLTQEEEQPANQSAESAEESKHVELPGSEEFSNDWLDHLDWSQALVILKQLAPEQSVLFEPYEPFTDVLPEEGRKVYLTQKWFDWLNKRSSEDSKNAAIVMYCLHCSPIGSYLNWEKLYRLAHLEDDLFLFSVKMQIFIDKGLFHRAYIGIKRVIVSHSELPWARLIWHCLPTIFTGLEVEGFLWDEAKAVSDLKEQLTKPLQLKLHI